MKHTKSRNGFTLIELIIVMVILGIMAAVAVPRYLDSISNAEEAAEDAVISAIRSGLTQYASNSLYKEGRAIFPVNPFEVLSEKPTGYTTDNNLANEDGEWTFVNWYSEEEDGQRLRTGKITHQRADNSRWQWDYNAGTRLGDDAKVGSLGEKEEFTPR
jgi:prepilin-type N-terminal cleavage/methylation domain-containing protein